MGVFINEQEVSSYISMGAIFEKGQTEKYLERQEKQRKKDRIDIISKAINKEMFILNGLNWKKERGKSYNSVKIQICTERLSEYNLELLQLCK